MRFHEAREGNSPAPREWDRDDAQGMATTATFKGGQAPLSGWLFPHRIPRLAHPANCRQMRTPIVKHFPSISRDHSGAGDHPGRAFYPPFLRA
jgi:hypothetical protein